MVGGYDLNRDIIEPGKHIPLTGNEISQGQLALDELSQILERMGIRAQVFYREHEDSIFLEIRGNNLGLVIGKHGQTLDAIEFILNVIHRKRHPEAKQLILDAQGYREKKKSVLKKILSNAREEVLSTREEVSLDPMTPADRKLIHVLCKDVRGIKSESRGDGINRRVIIMPDREDDRFRGRILN